ncbi:hypothetical protein OPV22_013619 [Ensete ventricosum]|uniref:Uncharacterized protein n=1 Tax=Ensete ventricosum TaxID=4639 RepID=A0AAV8R1E0_ENSVE|nr:hypothetical protein OPV22_013619 [Ensete ventricosum]
MSRSRPSVPCNDSRMNDGCGRREERRPSASTLRAPGAGELRRVVSSSLWLTALELDFRREKEKAFEDV